MTTSARRDNEEENPIDPTECDHDWELVETHAHGTRVFVCRICGIEDSVDP